MSNPWITHLKAYHKEHPDKSYTQCMKDAKASYKPLKGKGNEDSYSYKAFNKLMEARDALGLRNIHYSKSDWESFTVSQKETIMKQWRIDDKLLKGKGDEPNVVRVFKKSILVQPKEMSGGKKIKHSKFQNLMDAREELGMFHLTIPQHNWDNYTEAEQHALMHRYRLTNEGS